MSGPWSGRSVLVTGGASFIGSHLVEELVRRGAHVRVVDDLSSGLVANLAGVLDSGRVELMVEDLLEPGVARAACGEVEVVFHLAADHGGRGYVETRQAGPAGNLCLDGTVFREAARAGVRKIVYASSGCVYPGSLQGDPNAEVYLAEHQAGPPYEPDNMYGWAKLSAELTLQAYRRELGLESVSCRYFVVYGPRAREDHAVIAMIARAFVGQDPFEVWGSGEQVRNWTYVDDIVEGTLLAAERIGDGSAVNLGTTERVTVREAALLAQELMGHRAPILPRPEMPTGPLNRVADATLARELLGWTARVSFREGLARTIDWYRGEKDRDEVARLVDNGGLLASRALPVYGA